MHSEFSAYLPWQLFYKGCRTFKPLSGQALLHLTVHLLLSADNITVSHAHTHNLFAAFYLHNIKRFKQILKQQRHTDRFIPEILWSFLTL